MNVWDEPSDEAAVRDRSGMWHRLRSRRVPERVDGIPVIHSFVQCGGRVNLSTAPTRWGYPDWDTHRCRRCWS